MVNQILSFILNHWVLSGLFVLLLIALVIQEWLNRKTGADTVSPEEGVQMINHQQALVIDIRNTQAFLEGHILGSVHVTLDTFDKKWALLEKSKDKPFIIVCAMGQEATKMAMLLKEKGCRAFVLKGGLQEWRGTGLPLVKK